MNGDPSSPHDAFSEGAFQPPGFRRDDWRPPWWARTAVWVVKDVGVPIAALVILTAVLLGWVDSPLMRLRDIDARTALQVQDLTRHADATTIFQAALLGSLQKQRCMSAITSIITNAEAIARAALASDPCALLENLPRGRP